MPRSASSGALAITGRSSPSSGRCVDPLGDDPQRGLRDLPDSGHHPIPPTLLSPGHQVTGCRLSTGACSERMLNASVRPPPSPPRS
jgi:hypothetical protein